MDIGDKREGEKKVMAVANQTTMDRTCDSSTEAESNDSPCVCLYLQYM